MENTESGLMRPQSLSQQPLLIVITVLDAFLTLQCDNNDNEIII